MIAAWCLAVFWAASGPSTMVVVGPKEIGRISDPGKFFAAASQYVDANPPGADATFELTDEAAVKSGTDSLVLIDRIGRESFGPDTEKVRQWSMRRARETASIAERILQVRNVMRVAPSERAFVGEQLRSLLGDSALEKCRVPVVAQVFDGVVFLGDSTFLPDLGAVLSKRRFTVLSAQALDRLAEKSPLAMMRALNGTPEILQDRPLLRADLFAKGDLADPEVRLEFERYLLRGDVPLEAKQKAIFELLQSGHVLSIGIFTGVDQSPRADRPLVSREVLEQWLHRPAMAALVPTIRECLSLWDEAG